MTGAFAFLRGGALVPPLSKARGYVETLSRSHLGAPDRMPMGMAELVRDTDMEKRHRQPSVERVIDREASARRGARVVSYGVFCVF